MIHGNACLSGQDKRQADSLFTRGVEDAKILPGDMGKVQQCPKFSLFIHPKLSFCFPKGKLLQCKRSCIGVQKLSF